ncbi:MAG TPA: glycosyltransferase family 2 protein [Anaerolineaceae bacterium]|nr:glycosyltransferase family 2 protein [Anaerolineaceae bacterium]
MYKGKKIGVVVPAYNEEILILDTLKSMPDIIDCIFVVEDGSTDCTLALIEEQQQIDGRIQIIAHSVNQGLGKSLIDGYEASLKSDMDYTAVMDGDNQMDPDDLPVLLDQLVDHGYDYVKGNRLLHSNIRAMPLYRFLGNALLTILTKFATGYYRLMDPQCAYAVIRNNVLAQLPIQNMTHGYGYNAEILTMLNIQGFSVTNVEVRPVYDREKSKINLWTYIPRVTILLIRLFFQRLWWRYMVRDFNPLVLLYMFGFSNIIFILIPFTIRFFVLWRLQQKAPEVTLLILLFTTLITFQSLIFAVWMDMDYNKDRKN